MRTERLLLRPFADSDLPVVVELQSSRATHPHETAPSTPAWAHAQFDAWRRHWSKHGFGYVAIEHAESGEVIGVGGVQLSELDGEPVLNLFYRLRPEAWGHGYAPEMATAVLGWTARHLPGTAIVIVTGAGNGPARRVAEKMGFEEVRRTLYAGMPAVVYRRENGRTDAGTWGIE